MIAAAKQAIDPKADCALILGVGDALAIDPTLGAWLQAGGSAEWVTPSLDFAAVSLSVTDLDIAGGKGVLGSLADAGVPVALANASMAGDGEALYPSQIITACQGHRIALLGVTAPDDVPSVRIDEPIAAVQRVLDESDIDADVVIVLSNAGAETDRAMASRVEGIDVIVGSGVPPVDAPERVDGSETVILRTGYPGRSLGVALIDVDAAGDVVSRSWAHQVFPAP